MTEITRVPLQPIARGALTKLWLGVLAVALAAAGLAWYSMPPGVKVETVKAGSGAYPKAEDVVFIKYVGKLASDGKEFDRSPDQPLIPIPGLLPDGVPMLVSGVVPGFSEGLQKMQKGGKYTLRIPAEKGYGANPPPESPIPPNADLVFDVEVIDVMSREQAERRFQAAQAMMAQQEAGEAGKDGAPKDGKDAAPAKPAAPEKK